MKTFVNCAAQGDIYIQKIDQLLDGLIKEKPIDGQHIIAHSETGHHHVMKDVDKYTCDNPMIMFIIVKRPTILKHQRAFDKHEDIEFKPGTYEIRRQREYVPEGWRRIED
jgi:hypothetical protein